MNLTITLDPGTLEPGTLEPGTLDLSDDAQEEPPFATGYPRCSDGNGTLSHLFFSDDDHELARAKAICRPCGLRHACLQGAIERAEPYGVWGGLLVLDGVPVEFKRKRGRPRKEPVAVLVVDEVPMPPHLVA
jgi:WhiB family transcriptional regulator, redox-sensing transcriptional regulator